MTANTMDPAMHGAMLDVTPRVTVQQVIDIHARLAALPSLAPSATADPSSRRADEDEHVVGRRQR